MEMTVNPKNWPSDTAVAIAADTPATAVCAAVALPVTMVAVTVTDPSEVVSVMSLGLTRAAAARLAM